MKKVLTVLLLIIGTFSVAYASEEVSLTALVNNNTLTFDASELPENAVITSATLNLTGNDTSNGVEPVEQQLDETRKNGSSRSYYDCILEDIKIINDSKALEPLRGTTWIFASSKWDDIITFGTKSYEILSCTCNYGGGVAWYTDKGFLVITTNGSNDSRLVYIFNINNTEATGFCQVVKLDSSNPLNFYASVALSSRYSLEGVIANNPVMSVLPATQSVSSNVAGTTTFAVSNVGYSTSTMKWTATVTEGSDWLSIQSGSSGTNSGTITCSYSATNSSLTINAIIKVTASGTTGSPKYIKVRREPVIKPTVITGVSDSITATTATLNGTVNPNGVATTCQFQYGTTTGYGSLTPAADAGSGTTDKTVSAYLTGLSANTTYHFRMVAWNDIRTTNGQDQTFTTLQQVGSLTVTLSPANAVTAGAQWQVDSGAWNNSGATLSNLTVGTHTVSFKTITGWTTPPVIQSVNITNGQTATATGTYFQESGSLTVTISPANAVTAGAMWQVDGGVWNNSSATVSNLTVGTHTVSFKIISGWTTPVSQTVTIQNGQTATANGTYIKIELPESVTSYKVLTDQSGQFTINYGEYVKLFGSGGNTITLKSGGKVECVNFIGANVVNIENSASGFTVRRSGATVYLENSSTGTLVKIPASKTIQTINFAGGVSYGLVISNDSKVMFGNKVVGLTELQL